jgi:hypothetical protein
MMSKPKRGGAGHSLALHAITVGAPFLAFVLLVALARTM